MNSQILDLQDEGTFMGLFCFVVVFILFYFVGFCVFFFFFVCLFLFCLAGKSCIAWFRPLFLFTSANALLLVLRVLDKVPELSEGMAELFCCQPVCLFSKYISPGFSSLQLGVWLIYNRRAWAGAAWNAPSCKYALQQSLVAGQESFLSSFVSLLRKKKITKR